MAFTRWLSAALAAAWILVETASAATLVQVSATYVGGDPISLATDGERFYVLQNNAYPWDPSLMVDGVGAYDMTSGALVSTLRPVHGWSEGLVLLTDGGIIVGNQGFWGGSAVLLDPASGDTEPLSVGFAGPGALADTTLVLRGVDFQWRAYEAGTFSFLGSFNLADQASYPIYTLSYAGGLFYSAFPGREFVDRRDGSGAYLDSLAFPAGSVPDVQSIAVWGNTVYVLSRGTKTVYGYQISEGDPGSGGGPGGGVPEPGALAMVLAAAAGGMLRARSAGSAEGSRRGARA